MKFIDSYVNAEHRFSLGREVESGRFYLSIPVSNRLADYEEYYELSQAAHDAYPGNLPEILRFVNRCKARMCDELLLVPPGRDRGVA
ncbi:hypothetical protein LZ009_10005 [Ramlibacter sp. XY19]|uniref:hypothetical protein n=1 Tax=Ramlibacter paludis TaxID=2908000 RepID=UPI0023D99673|nr:hypothetical protein [Ramlibacter paludis]MCG2593113.1 hypothetical protein [Ramlibacter paludis]